MNKNLKMILVLAFFCQIMPHAVATPIRFNSDTQLNALENDQRAALRVHLKGNQASILCRGNYTGRSGSEAIIAVWPHDASSTRQINLLALLFKDNSWVLSPIVADSSARTTPTWNYELDETGIVADIKCNPHLEADPDTSDGKGRRIGKSINWKSKEFGTRDPSLCLSTSSNYNNWDCFGYVPSEGKFQLQYQQIFAD